MALSLKQTCFQIWKSNFDRKGIAPQFKPIFTRFIGVDDTSEYSDILKTYQHKFLTSDRGIVFDGSIPMSAEFEIINSVKAELQTMDISQLEHQDIVIFESQEVNSIFLASLSYVVQKAIAQEHFMNDNVRNNFITKLIVWAFLYARKVTFDTNIAPKCFYYGNISRHEMYFLMMLHRMTFDVIYVNPQSDDINWNEVDSDKLSTVVNSKQILNIETLADKTRNAETIEYIESQTLQIERELEAELFTNTGVFRPWQFRNGNVKAMFMNTSIIDLKQNWNEPARVRQGFKVEGKTVIVPNLFHQIDGEYKDAGEYYELVHTCTESANTLFLRSNELQNLLVPFPDDSEKLKIAFCQRGDETFDLVELKKLSFYRYEKYRDDVEKFIIDAANAVMKKNKLFKFNFTKDMQINFMTLVLCMNDKLVRLIDNFDFPADVPKVTIFLENEETMPEDITILLGFLSTLGFDIAVFSPAGMQDNGVLNMERVNNTRLDTMVYDRKYTALKAPRKGLFKKFF